MPLPVRADMTAEQLHARLWDEYAIEVPITEWNDQRFVRVSIQAYNTPRDVDRLVGALAACLG
jgi:isopenicillin-N epimerase